jgi:hypothetical protein
VAPSGNGVGSKVDGGHSKSSLPGPEVSSSPGERPRASSESPYVAHSAPAPDKTVRPTVSSEKLDSLTIDAIAHRDEIDHRIVQQSQFASTLTGQREAAIGGGRVRVYANRPPDRTPGRHFTRAFCIDGRSGGASKLIPKDTYGKSKSSV